MSKTFFTNSSNWTLGIACNNLFILKKMTRMANMLRVVSLNLQLLILNTSAKHIMLVLIKSNWHIGLVRLMAV